MKLRYFAATDTLYVELSERAVHETRDLDENTVLDVDAEGNLCAITDRARVGAAGVPQFSYELVTA